MEKTNLLRERDGKVAKEGRKDLWKMVEEGLKE